MIYLDNASTTKPYPIVLDAMLHFLQENYANPSSVYSMAQNVRSELENARAKVANALNADEHEIYFTSGGTEAINWAINSVIKTHATGHIITTNVEHHATLNLYKNIDKSINKSYEITYLPVDSFGMVSAEAVYNAIKENTILVDIILANNEIGSINPISEIAKIIQQKNIMYNKKIIFHTDAVAAAGHIAIDVQNLGIDMLSISAHKFYGPKGVGALFCRTGLPLSSFIYGGNQENGKRGGTENVAGIIGMGVALEAAMLKIDKESLRLKKIKDNFINQIKEKIPDSVLNGHPTVCLPNNINISFKYIEGESLIMILDSKDIIVSSGAACISGQLEPSHVLLAIKAKKEYINGTLRISLGSYNTEKDLEKLLEELPAIIEDLKIMSPQF